MAINIFSGGGTGKRGTHTNVPTNTGKAATSGVSKVVGKVGELASKYGNLIPGVGGIVSTVGKLVSKNDPEWWQNVPGTGVSTNIPLAYLESKSEIGVDALLTSLRPGILSIVSGFGKAQERSTPGTGIDHKYFDPIIWPQADMISTYLMQNIRKVVNAVPLQAPEAYRQVLINQATAYALKHQLDKMIYLSMHSQPYLPSLTDGSYELLSAQNYPTLVGLRDRLADYCKASVRIPHTLCQYLAWRYGRVYRTGNSAKCGLVTYDVIPLHATTKRYVDFVNHILGYVSANGAPVWVPTEVFGVSAPLDSSAIDAANLTPTAKQAAQADMFNAFRDHVIDVQVKPETQFTYDPKEFVLRTNMDCLLGDQLSDPSTTRSPNPELIYMDSDLDNITTFMASTVSTAVFTNNGYYTALFPVRYVYAYVASLTANFQRLVPIINAELPTTQFSRDPFISGASYWVGSGQDVYGVGSWSKIAMYQLMGRTEAQGASDAIAVAIAVCKALEFYNAEIYDAIDDGVGTRLLLDLTAMSQDLARVPTDIIRNTHVYAFANLVFDGIKSYAAKEMPKAIKAAEEMAADVVDAVTPSSVTVTPAPTPTK